MRHYLQEACSVIDAAIKEGIDGEERADLRGIVQGWLEPLALSPPPPATVSDVWSTPPPGEIQAAVAPTFSIPYETIAANRPGSQHYIEELRTEFPGDALPMTDEVALFCAAREYCEEGGALAFLGDGKLWEAWETADAARFTSEWNAEEVYEYKEESKVLGGRGEFHQRRWLFLVAFAREKLASKAGTVSIAAPEPLSYLGIALTPITGPAKDQAEGNLRLLELAAVLDVAGGYDQTEFLHSCGSPACAMGFFFTMHPERYVIKNRSLYSVDGAPLSSAYALTKDLYLTTYEGDRIFSAHGCGDARRDGRQAATYIRDFVARRGDGSAPL